MSKSLTQMTKAELILHAQILAGDLHAAEVLGTQMRNDLFFAKKKLTKLYERVAPTAPGFMQRVKEWGMANPHAQMRLTIEGAVHNGAIVVPR